MSIATFLVTDEARTGICLDFIHPEYRSSSTGRTRASHLERSDGDLPVHPFEWDANVYPCPGCFVDDPRVEQAIAAGMRAAAALCGPVDNEWENVRVTSWAYYRALVALWKTVDAEATIYDRKDALLHLIGTRAAQSYYNVCMVWILRAARQHRVGAGTTVRRWEEAAGLIDGLLQSPIGKDTQNLELSPDFLRVLSCTALACAHEVSLAYYIMDTQHQCDANVQLAHSTEYLYALVQTILLRSANVPQHAAWVNFAAIKVEYYAGMTLYLASLEPGTRVGSSRRRRAQERFSNALEEIDQQRGGERTSVAAEVSELIAKCTKFHAWKRKGAIPEAVRAAYPFRNTTASEYAFEVPPTTGIVPVDVPAAVLEATAAVVGPSFNSRAVMGGMYGQHDDAMALRLTMVQQDVRARPPIACLTPGGATVASAIAAALSQASFDDAVAPAAAKAVDERTTATSQAPGAEEAVAQQISGEMIAGDAEAETTTATDGGLAAARQALQEEETAAQHGEHAKRVSVAAHGVAYDAGALPVETVPHHLIQVNVNIGTVAQSLADFQRALRDGNNDHPTRCAIVFVVDLNHDDKAVVEKLRNCVICSLQNARLSAVDRVGLVEFDPVDATPSVHIVPATEANLKKLSSRILRLRGRGRFPASHGTPIVAGTAAAVEALGQLEDALHFTGNQHIVLLSNGDDRTAISDQQDWLQWSASTNNGATTQNHAPTNRNPSLSRSGSLPSSSQPAVDEDERAAAAASPTSAQHGDSGLRAVLKQNGIQVHTAAVSFEADDALLASMSLATNGFCHRVIRQDDEGTLVIQKLIMSVLATAVARVASDVRLTVEPARQAVSSSSRNGDDDVTEEVRTIRVAAIEGCDARPLPVVGSPKGPLQNKRRTSFHAVTSLASAPSDAVSVGMLPFAVGQASNVLITFAVPHEMVRQDVLTIGTVTLSYRRNGAGASSAFVSQPVVHVNTSRVEDRILHARLRQACILEAHGPSHIMPGGSDACYPVRGHEVVCEGDGIRTAEDGVLSISTVPGARVDLQPGTEVRIEQVHAGSFVLHLCRGSVAVSTPQDQRVTVTSDGYVCTIDGESLCRITHSDASLLAKTLAGRCTVQRAAHVDCEHRPDAAPASALQRVSLSATAAPVELLASRQVTARHDEADTALPAPWLLTLTDEERASILPPPPLALERSTANDQQRLDLGTESNDRLRAAMVIDTTRCRLAIVELLGLLHRKLENQLRVCTKAQTPLVQRARKFQLSANIGRIRTMLANSTAYICHENDALDSWRAAFEHVSRFVFCPEDMDPLAWRDVNDVLQLKRAIAHERPFAISLPVLFPSTDLLEQVAHVVQDRNERRDASKQIRLEEQTLMRQTEDNRREFALLRLFQLLQWEGFETVWAKDVVGVLSTLPYVPLFQSIASRGASMLAAVGLQKSLTDEQFATVMGVLMKDLTPAEFTVTLEAMARRCMLVQDAAEASAVHRAFFSLCRALGVGSGDGLCTPAALQMFFMDALSRKSWPAGASTCAATTTAEVLGTRWALFFTAALDAHRDLIMEVTRTPLRRKSTVALMREAKAAQDGGDAAPAPSEDEPVPMLSMVPEAPDDADAAFYTRELSMSVLLTGLEAYFEPVEHSEETMLQLHVLAEAADASRNKNRAFSDMLAHEAKLKEKQHLLDWERRHLFNGITAKHVASAMAMDHLPPQVHTALHVLVAPVCIFTDMIPAKKTQSVNLFEGFHAEGTATTASAGGGSGGSSHGQSLWDSTLDRSSRDRPSVDSATHRSWQILRDQLSDMPALTHRLSTFSPMCVSHRVLLRAAPFLDHEDLNPQMLSSISPVIAALAKWILLMLRLTYLQHDYDAVEATVPTKLLGYVQSKAFAFPAEQSPSLAIVAAALRPTSAALNRSQQASPHRNVSPTRATSGRVSPTGSGLTPSRPTSAAKSRVWAQVCAVPPKVGSFPLLSTVKYAEEGPRPPTFTQKLHLRPSTAGTVRSGYTEVGPLPAATAPSIRSPAPPPSLAGGSYPMARRPVEGGHGAAYVPSDIASLAQREVLKGRTSENKSKTIMRPQSAYVRGATQSFHLGSRSQRIGSTIGVHHFFGDDVTIAPSPVNGGGTAPLDASSSVLSPHQRRGSSTGFRHYHPYTAPSPIDDGSVVLENPALSS